MRLKRLLLLIIVALLCSCSRDEVGVSDLTSEKIEVIIGATTSGSTTTRAILDDNYDFSWEKGDEISLFAKAGSSTASKVGDFAYIYDSNTNKNSLFSGDISSMSDGSYSYYLNYPKATRVSGTTITHTISDSQDGTYNCNYDLMWGYGTGGALTHNMAEYITLPFSNHLMHIIRFEVPTESNIFGSDITKMVVAFDRDVVGDISYNYESTLAPTTSVSNGESTVTLNLSGDNVLGSDGKYAYMFINPTNFVDSELKIVVYNENGSYSNEKVATINRNMVAGEITPLTLTPEGVYLATTIQLKLTANNLGEDITNVIFTSPNENALFTNGSNVVTLPYSPTNTYEVVYENMYDSYFSGNISVQYESEHALVSGNDIVILDLNSHIINPIIDSIPYLLYEDFSGLTSDFSIHDNQTIGANITDGIDSDYTGTTNLSTYGLPTGWTAGRVGGSATYKSIRICGREEAGGKYPGRIDTAPLNNLQKSVDVEVLYNYSAGETEYSGGSGLIFTYGVYGDPAYEYGSETNSAAQNGNTSLANTLSVGVSDSGSGSVGTWIKLTTGGSYSNIQNNGSYKITNATSATRAAWRSSCIKEDYTVQNGNYWLYLDNIRIKITGGTNTQTY